MGRGTGSWVGCRESFFACILAALLAVGACGEGEDAATTESSEASVEQVLIDFGAAKGSDACNYGNDRFLERYGGRAGCDRNFAKQGAVEYAISDVQVDGEEAAGVVDPGRGMLKFDLVLEDGTWTISRFRPTKDETLPEPEVAAAGEETAPATDPAADEAAVEQTIVDYGLAEGDPACDYLTEKYIELIGGCESNVRNEFEVSKVQVEGDKASAVAETGGTTNRYELVRDGEEWKISLVGVN